MRFLGAQWLWIVLWELCAQAELFKSVAKMEVLLHTQGAILDILHSFIELQQIRLDLLKSHYAKMNVEHQLAEQQSSSYLFNPLNVFRLLKTLDVDKKLLMDLDHNFENVSLVLPDKNDLDGAIAGLLRLQSLYDLGTEDLADGKIFGVKRSLPMSSEDCYETAQYAFSQKLYRLSKEWLETALRKHVLLSDRKSHIIKILERLIICEHTLGNTKRALNLIQQIIEINPKHPFKMNKKIYQPLLENRTPSLHLIKTNLQNQEKQKKMKYTIENSNRGWEVFKSHCNWQTYLGKKNAKNLKCYYVMETHSFLRLAPLKLEQLNLDPYVVLYHDVIYANEIDFLIKTSTNQLAPSEIDPFVSDRPTIDDRISSIAWLSMKEIALAHLTRRITDMTGLDIEYAEDYQVANYGIAGQYYYHYDILTANMLKYDSLSHIGQRLASLIFYMSDVEERGATVFAGLGLGIKPQKGTALFWYNLLPSMEGDRLTMHGACPVLLGNKWTVNVWIHQHGQELRKPCYHQYKPENSRIYK